MRHLLLVAISLVLVVVVPAQVRVTGTEFDPVSFVPGDKVLLIARFDPAGLPWNEVRETSGFPGMDDTDLSILSAAIERRSGAPVLVLQFIPWKAGRGQLPSLNIGGVIFPVIGFEAMSSLGTDLSPPRARPQLEPPGLRLRVYIATGLLLTFVVAVLVFLSLVLPWLRRLKARWDFARVRREFDARLAMLDDNDGLDANAWARLCGSLRWYLEARTKLPWMAMTASESAEVQDALIASDLVAETTGILHAGDEVRFAGKNNAALPAALASARSIADRLDKALTTDNGNTAGGRK